jgi:hypothetical protein
MFVYIACSLDLKWSDLPVKPLMVPLMQELLRQGVGKARPATLSVAGQVVMAPAQTTRLRPWAAATSALPDAAASDRGLMTVDEWGHSSRPMRQAGVWDAVDAGGGRRGLVVVNADPAGGDLSSHERAGLEGWLNKSLQGGQLAWVAPGTAAAAGQPFKTAMATHTQGRPTTALLLAAALALAIVEMMLARWASH